MAVKWWHSDNTVKTRDAFLVCIAAVYMFAFGSVYTQIPGKFLVNQFLGSHAL